MLKKSLLFSSSLCTLLPCICMCVVDNRTERKTNQGVDSEERSHRGWVCGLHCCFSLKERMAIEIDTM